MQQILKRARNAEMDIIPSTESENNVREEVNRRTCKAGHTNREGGPPSTGNIRSMPFSERGRSNYETIFGHK